MSRYKPGDILSVNGKTARVVWVREDPNEIEAMDEYIVEFDDHEKLFFVSSELEGLSLRRTA
jgi:hypothetical protein